MGLQKIEEKKTPDSWNLENDWKWKLTVTKNETLTDFNDFGDFKTSGWKIEREREMV